MCIYWAIGQLYTHISLHQNLSRSGCTTSYILWIETLNNKLLVSSGIHSHQAVYKGGPCLSAVRHVIELCCTLLETRRSNDVGYFGHKATDRSFDLVRVIFLSAHVFWIWDIDKLNSYAKHNFIYHSHTNHINYNDCLATPLFKLAYEWKIFSYSFMYMSSDYLYMSTTQRKALLISYQMKSHLLKRKYRDMDFLSVHIRPTVVHAPLCYMWFLLWYVKDAQS